MTMTSPVAAQRRTAASDPPAPAVPTAALLVMALVGFLLISTETMPAGLLPQIAAGTGVDEGTAGLYVSAYALGTIVAAIPAVAITQSLRRRPVLLSGLVVFGIANTLTALSTNIVVALGARVIAGMCSGLLWGMLAGYARRITAPAAAGRALSIASLGTPVGLAVGTPLGSFVGTSWGWQWAFAALTLLIVVTVLLVLRWVPDAPGQRADARFTVRRVVFLPGVPAIVAVIVAWMVGHNTMYTYVSSYLRDSHSPVRTDAALVVFGVAALVGIWITGAFIDRALRRLVLSSVVLFVTAAVTLAAAGGSPVLTVAAIVVWGVAFGGAAAQLQTAVSRAAGPAADVANAVLGVAFNVAIFVSGLVGGALLQVTGGLALPIVMAVLGVAAYGVALGARHHGFPDGWSG